MIRKKGFTLIELLVTISIVSLLSAIVFAALGNSKNKASNAAITSQLKSMAGQAQLFTGVTGGGTYILSDPLPTPSTILSTAPLCTSTFGTLFCDAGNNSLYPVLSKLPSGTVLWYGWNGISPFDGGRWFVAASTPTGAVCVDWVNSAVRTWVGTPPTQFSDFSSPAGGTTGAFPNANAGKGYKCTYP